MLDFAASVTLWPHVTPDGCVGRPPDISTPDVDISVNEEHGRRAVAGIVMSSGALLLLCYGARTALLNS